jgi:hypothetical protein
MATSSGFQRRSRSYPGKPFTPELQAWTRDAFHDPDWLRVGTDIVGGSPAPTFNMTFSLSGEAIPSPPADPVRPGSFGGCLHWPQKICGAAAGTRSGRRLFLRPDSQRLHLTVKIAALQAQ